MSRPSARLDNLRHQAEKFGDKRAQFRLAQMYLEGDVVDRDVDEARHWLEISAEQEYPEAVRMLAKLKGEPMPEMSEDLPEAIEEPAPPPAVESAPPVITPDPEIRQEWEQEWQAEENHTPPEAESGGQGKVGLDKDLSGSVIWYIVIGIYIVSQVMCD